MLWKTVPIGAGIGNAAHDVRADQLLLLLEKGALVEDAIVPDILREIGRLAVALGRRLVIPGNGQVLVQRHADPVLVGLAHVELAVLPALLGTLQVPLRRRHPVLGHARAIEIKLAQPVLGPALAFFRRRQVPLGGLAGILGEPALAELAHVAHLVHRLEAAGLGRLDEMRQRTRLVARDIEPLALLEGLLARRRGRRRPRQLRELCSRRRHALVGGEADEAARLVQVFRHAPPGGVQKPQIEGGADMALGRRLGVPAGRLGGIGRTHPALIVAGADRGLAIDIAQLRRLQIVLPGGRPVLRLAVARGREHPLAELVLARRAGRRLLPGRCTALHEALGLGRSGEQKRCPGREEDATHHGTSPLRTPKAR